MSKKQYSDSMREITGISDNNAAELGIVPGIIACANEAGLKLLQVQFKVYNRYIKKRLNEYKNQSTT